MTHEGRRHAEDGDVLFDAVLYPHLSLTPKASLVVMSLVALISFAAGLVFASMGAWPVVGFFGLDVLLLGFFLHLSFRRARLYETIRLTADKLIVRRVHPNGVARSWSFQPFWLKVELHQPSRRGSELALVSHGQRLAFGSFLTGEEKQDLAVALRRSLDRLRRPPALDDWRVRQERQA